MRFLFLIFACVLGFGTVAVRAQEATPAPQSPDISLSIQDVISNQLDAFKDRDVAEAWTYASPFIKGIFGNPGNFGMMVERGYPMVWDNSAVRFIELRDDNGRQVQRISLRDADGGIHFLDYEMVQTPDGWQINGVVLVEPDLSA